METNPGRDDVSRTSARARRLHRSLTRRLTSWTQKHQETL